MSMTAREQVAKTDLLWVLAKDGYKAYAKILQDFDVNLTKDPNVVAYTEIDKGRIVINEGLRLNQVSMIVRHEILHNFLDHEKRLIKHLAQEANLDYDTLSDTDFEKLQNQLYSNQIFNIAADYEISNRGYTEADKKIVKGLWLNGKKVEGLITEVDHPDWVDLSVEEMYDKLRSENSQLQQQLQQQLQKQQGSQQNQQQQSQGSSGQSNSDQNNNTNNQSGNSKQNSQSGSGSKQPLRIGDKGDPTIQAKEDAERIKQAAEEMADEMKKGTSSDAKDSSKDLNNVAKDAESIVKDIKDGRINVDEDKELADRVERIKKSFEDAALQSAAIAEYDDHINQEKIDAQTREMLNYINDGTRRFQNSLASFIKKATAEQKDRTWRRPSRRSTGEQGELLMKGRSWVKNKHIPIINVYFDQSASWSDEDVQLGLKALGVLNRYKDKGEIKLNVYFFAVDVHENASDARDEQGTNLKAVLKDIQKKKPDNVVIMTDSDSEGDRLPYTEVPGAVWLLFKNGYRSQSLIDSIRGKTQNSVFDISDIV